MNVASSLSYKEVIMHKRRRHRENRHRKVFVSQRTALKLIDDAVGLDPVFKLKSGSLVFNGGDLEEIVQLFSNYISACNRERSKLIKGIESMRSSLMHSA